MKKWVLMTCLLLTQIGFAAELKIKISNLKNKSGQIMISIFDRLNAQGFPGQYQLAYETLVVNANMKEDPSLDLPPGQYAVAVFHDKNSNNELDTNLMGIPKESFGFSNNPKVLFGAPGFEKASFVLKQDKTLNIKLIQF